MKTSLKFLAALWFFACAQLATADEGQRLLRVPGTLSVAVYKEFAPFYDDGKGIDVDVARLIAERMDAKLSLLPFEADEKMEDDLRNMVWKGHYLGYGPADIMMHVPVDKAFMDRNDKVIILAPYFREQMSLVHNREKLAKVETMSVFEQASIGVEDASIGSMALLSFEGGKLIKNVRHYHDIGKAFDDLKAGNISAVLAMNSQVESAMRDSKGFDRLIPPLPGLPPAGWVLGVAVKAGNEELARRVQAIMNDLDKEGRLDEIFARYGVRRLRPL
ncbi:MAG: transporter substrate-binding domain-containing protein [Rhodocyclaceae bacterium]|nr:transporter substrate-binding domain-containing protein [Rhodocyclaceae bacterium]